MLGSLKRIIVFRFISTYKPKAVHYWISPVQTKFAKKIGSPPSASCVELIAVDSGSLSSRAELTEWSESTQHQQ